MANEGSGDDTLSKDLSNEFISLSTFTVYHSAEDLGLSTSQSLLTEEASNLMEHKVDLEAAPKYDKIDVGGTMFNDGVRGVDFVMVYAEKPVPHQQKAAEEKRRIFERNLVETEGLMLEHEYSKTLNFVKIHAPHEVLCRYAEILKLRMPMKEIPGDENLEVPNFDVMLEVKGWFDRFLNFVNVDPKIFKPTPHKLTAEFSRDKTYLFDTESENFFTCSIRILIVDYILERNKFSEDANKFAFGIHRLIADKTYEASYPLHDGGCHTQGCLRYLLYEHWASVRKWIRHQPIDHVKDYFGVKVGLYFAWLGFYTHMLIPAAFVGLICFIFGLSTMYSNTLSQDICNHELNITMCPPCDRKCDYWKLADTCSYARVTYLFDNPSTVFFAVFMSFWGTLFLELWKRYSAGIRHHWGLTGFDHQTEHPRPEYLARLTHVSKTKVNVVTGKPEPYVPFWRIRVPFTILSFTVVLLLISVAVGAVFGVVLYRMAILASSKLYQGSDSNSYVNVIVFNSATAAVINLICIMLLNWFYDWLAVKLTDLELLRTQSQYDDSLTLKIYMFQFVNYYTSIFYIAFLKGKFVGYPAKYNRIFSLRQEECGPGGCLMELCIQLAIIMVGKQAMNTVLEIVMPMFSKWFNTLRVKAGMRKAAEVEVVTNQWNLDYRLLDWGPRGLFPEYLEMVLQYGFVTIFVAAFPLAPLFALINNVFEMRLDAKKFLTFYRRPVPRRVKDIGVWFRILDILGRISVVTNAFIIAFSSNFIPQLVYKIVVNKQEHNVEGYLQHSLAYFNTTDFQGPINSTMQVDTCRYFEYRNPWSEDNTLKYKRSLIYWHILAARLAFVVVYQNVVGFVTLAIQGLIPDTPTELRDQMRREAYLTNETIICQETARARFAHDVNSTNLIAAEAGRGEGRARKRRDFNAQSLA